MTTTTTRINALVSVGLRRRLHGNAYGTNARRDLRESQTDQMPCKWVWLYMTTKRAKTKVTNIERGGHVTTSVTLGIIAWFPYGFRALFARPINCVRTYVRSVTDVIHFYNKHYVTRSPERGVWNINAYNRGARILSTGGEKDGENTTKTVVA